MKSRAYSSFLYVFMVFNAGNSQAAEIWYVNVLGENQQLITAASATKNIVDGVFLDKSFSGNKMYVRTREHYELDGFRQQTVTSGYDPSADAVSSAADAAGMADSKNDAALTSRFGPLTDSGLEVSNNGDFHGWWCSELYVTPLGNRSYELFCNKAMQYQ